MQTKKYNVGDLVIFGRQEGEKTLGRIVKVNPSKYKIEQLKARGKHPIGTTWGVPESLILAKVAQSEQTEQVLKEVLPEENKNQPGVFLVGQKVFFNDKTGHRIEGVILRVSKKTCSIQVPGTTAYWRVSPRYLNHVV